ncbi:hypothetical protein [Aegicerativicinus sediminis]
MEVQQDSTVKFIATLSYITIFGTIIAIFWNVERKNPLVAFHSRQGLGLCITYMIIGYLISQFDSLAISIGFWVFLGALFIYGIIGALTDKYNEVPFLGALFQNWFQRLGT